MMSFKNLKEGRVCGLFHGIFLFESDLFGFSIS